MNLGEDVRGTFRNDWFEFTVNGSINYNFEKNKLRPENNQEPYTFGYGASTNINMPWNMSLSTNITKGKTIGVNFMFTVSDKYEVLGCRMIADSGTFSDGEQQLVPVIAEENGIAYICRTQA